MRSSDENDLTKLSGLFDYDGYDEIVADLVSVTGLTREEVLEKLVGEFFKTGHNVVADAIKANIDVHVFNSKMEEFYKNTNAFLFELLVTHESPLCRRIDEKVMDQLITLSDGKRSRKVLVLGDGIGSDSLRFSRLGFDVTYFEFKGYSSALATRRFQRQGAQVTQINDLDQIPRNKFDFVVCREVLEHVVDPPQVIASINNYLTDDGHAMITESFERVHPDFPTHLRSNLQYAGKTVSMFIDAGFTFAGIIDDERPFIFRKTADGPAARRSSVPRRGLFSLAMRKIAFTILRKWQ